MNYFGESFVAGVWGRDMPPLPKWITWKHMPLSDKHCEECLSLDNRWFAKENSPSWPHHAYCHCIKIPLSYNEVLAKAEATSDYRKYDPYLLGEGNGGGNGKRELFNSWGYFVEDAQWLRNEIEQQALQKYVEGEYRLGTLDDYGQRISIRVVLPRKEGNGTTMFLTGWMVEPNGIIRLITPYGGK